MTEAIAAPSASPAATRMGYQPALDGVRGIAIAMVVLFHYPWGVRDPSVAFGNNPAHGGYLGVDAFFVLSGFLITTLLLQEHARSGRISLRDFYARRAFRLLPALGVLLLIALILHFALAENDANRPQLSGIFGVMFYVANWVNIYRPRALGVTSDTWSLAIEEQFYLLWPLAMLFLLRKRLRLRTIAVALAAGVAIVAAWRAWYWYDRMGGPSENAIVAYARGLQRLDVWNRIYFGSDTRADTLLVGSLTAVILFWLLPRLASRHRTYLVGAAAVAFMIAALIVARSSVVTSGWMPEWGFLVFELCVAVLIAGLVAMPKGWFTRAFAIPPLAWLGRRSYAVYLFHPLAFIFLARSRLHTSPVLTFAIRILAILLIAELSHRFVEAPMLRRKRRYEPAAQPVNPGLAADA
jgi:peptidoglycan/LPS O-acetylase OafA/YrhL